MTKSELLSSYKAPQLADMVIRLQSASKVKNDEIHKLKWQISSLEEENGRLQSKLDTYNNYLLPRCTKEAKEMIDHNHFSGVRVITWEQWNNREAKDMNISDIQKCQEEYEKVLKESPLDIIDKICRDILEQKNNVMAVEFTKIISNLLRSNGVVVKCTEIRSDGDFIEEKYGICFDGLDFTEHDKKFLDKIEKLKKTMAEKQSEIDNLNCKVEKYQKAFTEAKKERDMQVCEYQKKIDELKGKLEIQTVATKYAEEYVNSLKNDLDRTKTTVDQIDDILEKIFGVRHDVVAKPDEFEKILSDRTKGNITDFLPTEPIKVADMLINSSKKRTNCMTGKEYDKYIFEKWQLRQIAEHLLVYCNHNREAEEC